MSIFEKRVAKRDGGGGRIGGMGRELGVLMSGKISFHVETFQIKLSSREALLRMYYIQCMCILCVLSVSLHYITIHEGN